MYYIIVLGNANPIIMKKRVDRAVEFFYECKPLFVENGFPLVEWACLIFTGGETKEIGFPESEKMKAYCIEKYNIDPKYIITECNSRDTYENLMFTKRILEEGNYPILDYSKFIICTSTFHIGRSYIIAAHVFNEDTTKKEDNKISQRMNYKISNAGHKVLCIHTREKVSQEENIREQKHLVNFTNFILNEKIIDKPAIPTLSF